MYFLDLSVLIYLFYLSLFFLNVYRFSNQINISLCGLARVSVVESDCSAGDTEDAGSAPGWWWSPGGGNGNPLQFSCLKNLMNRGAWQATVHGVTGSRTQLSTPTPDRSQVLRNDEVLGGRVNVQGHVHDGEKGQQVGTLDTALPALWGFTWLTHFTSVTALLTQAEGSWPLTLMR